MGLFKKFNIGKAEAASRADLESFKSHLKYGDDPMEHWTRSREGWDQYSSEKKIAEDLLRKILKPEESTRHGNWSKMEVNYWSSAGKCPKSPINEHVYIHHYGDNNPNKGIRSCICCGKDL